MPFIHNGKWSTPQLVQVFQDLTHLPPSPPFPSSPFLLPDHPPSLPTPHPLPSPSPSPSSLLQVNATDIDSGDLGDVTYEIISGNVGGAFAIGNETGQVWVVGEVDKEVVDQYTLTILAEDGG